MKILIADDSGIIRDRVKAAIHGISATDQIYEASTIEDTLNRLDAVSPDVVILDLRMPDGSGTDVLKTIKAYPDPPVVIVFTSYPYPQYRRKCMDLGADYFFDKSKDFEKLSALIEWIHVDAGPSA
ncbi:MAG: response regulator transcription factor [Desulfobacterales bacterium]|nr:response regulator transcription factor [Desulfobacterales bacterium]